MILPELPPTPPSSTMPEHMVVSATFALAREALAWEHAHNPGCLDPLSAEDDTLAVMAVELLATLPLNASAWRGRKGARAGVVWMARDVWEGGGVCVRRAPPVRAAVSEREALELHTLHSVRIGAPWGWYDGQLCRPSVPSLALG